MEEKKQFKKLIFLFLIFLSFIWGIFYYFSQNYKMNFLDREYPLWLSKFVLLEEKSNSKIVTLILGDSRTMAGVLPLQLEQDSVSLSFGGSTPVEAEIILEEVLEKNIKVDNLLLAWAPSHYMEAGAFYSRTVYFDLFDEKKLREVGEIDKQQKIKGEYSQKKFLLNSKTLRVLKRPFLYKKSFFTYRKNNKKNNLKILREVLNNKGQFYFGRAKKSDKKNLETKYKNFNVLPVHQIYLDKIIEICKKNNIRVIIEQMPMNETSYKKLNKKFKNNYEEYMLSLKARYNLEEVNTKIWYLKNNNFGDASHVNKNGAKKVTKLIKEKYQL